MAPEKAQARKPIDRRGGSSRSPHRQAEAKGMQAEPEEPRDRHIGVNWRGRGVMIPGEYGACVVRMPAVKDWAEYEEKQLRQVVAELKLGINGHVKVTMAHARLPEDFGSTVGAGAPEQVFREKFGGCVMTVHPGVQDRDVQQFKDILRGDDTVNGIKRKYGKGEHRRQHQMPNSRSPNKIRVHAYAANLKHKNDTCAVVFCFRLGPGAKVSLRSLNCSFYS
ncbi:hypothetical protein BBO_05083 [Beauveria brongniartii RCEF 3172]|uniref:Uncharacterized protein n=1 Tax=Beauveria brongniartii RCEF 3172 TaxID=1081107 RepID=A0A167DHX9_9HYPO|nr:hypothetical protein BBO_05083 [Beauveria brongniartii RCEF 3172]